MGIASDTNNVGHILSGPTVEFTRSYLSSNVVGRADFFEFLGLPGTLGFSIFAFLDICFIPYDSYNFKNVDLNGA